MDRHPSLYERDILLWSEEQADALRRLKAGRRDLPNELDLDNIVEEIESVGRSELHAVESLLVQALSHLLKLARDPGGDAANHWRGEITAFLGQARRQFAPSMRQRIDLAAIWADAVRQLANARLIDRAAADALTQGGVPFTLDALLNPDLDLDAAAARIAPPPPADD